MTDFERALLSFLDLLDTVEQPWVTLAEVEARARAIQQVRDFARGWAEGAPVERVAS